MIGNILSSVVTQQPKERQLNGIAVVNKLQTNVTIKNSSVIPLTWKNRYMHSIYIHTHSAIAIAITTTITSPLHYHNHCYYY